MGVLRLGKPRSWHISHAPRLNDRDIASLTLGPQSSGTTISFADGSSVQEAFLAHKPPTKLNGPFAAQLRVELTPAGDVKVTPPFGATSLKGVYAAGDCATAMKNAMPAMHMGTFAGVGIALDLQAEALIPREEIFFPTLAVEATIDFASRVKVPFKLPPGIVTHDEYAQFYKDFLLRSVGISHTAHTKVGDTFIRGVSGGERKRVSILECMTTRASVYCWDNSTRGLDASTALDRIKAIRVMTDILGLSTIVTLYQAGNGIYEQFDKVLVFQEGKQT
ncbi:hypothetical protein ARSEF4850_008299 [Beauveria asiatica]